MANRIKPRNINFYKAFYAKPPVSQKTSRKRLYIAVPLLIAVAMLGGFSFLFCQLYQAKQELAELRAYTQDPANLAQQRQSADLQIEMQNYNQQLQLLQEAQETLDSLPKLYAEDFKTIYDCAPRRTNIIGLQYEESNGTLIIKASSPTQEDAPLMVQNLRATGLFMDISYVGYQSDNESLYYFDASCLRKGGDWQ